MRARRVTAVRSVCRMKSLDVEHGKVRLANADRAVTLPPWATAHLLAQGQNVLRRSSKTSSPARTHLVNKRSEQSRYQRDPVFGAKLVSDHLELIANGSPIEIRPQDTAKEDQLFTLGLGIAAQHAAHDKRSEAVRQEVGRQAKPNGFVDKVDESLTTRSRRRSARRLAIRKRPRPNNTASAQCKRAVSCK